MGLGWSWRLGVVAGIPVRLHWSFGLLLIWIALPVLADIRVNPMTAAVTAIVVNAGAYIAEIVRGAFLSVHKGLREAGLALGLPMWKVLFYILGPVAFRRMIPPLGNQFVYMLKASSLLSVIGLTELTRRANELVVTEYRPLEIYTFLILEYLVLILLASWLVRRLERRMAASDRIRVATT